MTAQGATTSHPEFSHRDPAVVEAIKNWDTRPELHDPLSRKTTFGPSLLLRYGVFTNTVTLFDDTPFTFSSNG